MGLRQHDLEYTIDNVFEIDSYKSKMGEDSDIVTLSFAVKGDQPAKDLVKFIETGYDFVLDADKTSGEQSDGKYRVFVEIERSKKSPNQILEILDGVKKISNQEDLRFRYYKNFRSHTADESSINEHLPLDPGAYDIKTNETHMENYKNFFADSYVDEVFMEGNSVILTKKYADTLAFEFVDVGYKTQILESIDDSIQIEAFPEIIFLSKYVGDYNITKYGTKLVFENKGHCVILEKKYETI
jgi:hypothetical protein|tara:strand:- start:1318 stop:2043 length:726 start_codon:yes stop_codon:yes gene_type:complete